MIISFYNNKGGVLKTTSAINIASLLAMDNKKVIVLDLDAQANIANVFLTYKQKREIKHTLLDFLKEEVSLKEIVDVNINKNIKSKIPNKNLFLLYGDSQLAEYDTYIDNNIIPKNKLKDLILKLNEDFDYVIIDNSPSKSTLANETMNIAELIVVPFEPSNFSIEGILNIISKIDNNFISKDVIMIPTRFNGSSIHKKNVISIENSILNRKINNTNNNILVSKSKISFNKYNDMILELQKLPLVLSNKYEKNIEKYKQEYIELKNEITSLNEVKQLNKGEQ